MTDVDVNCILCDVDLIVVIVHTVHVVVAVIVLQSKENWKESAPLIPGI